ncbi:MAG: phosphonate ABC transporter, permease protein PhnE [Meiothermus sp.]|nr:phosphonate ABC transporter, permease protein PhnE [Meiothermus sp.]
MSALLIFALLGAAVSLVLGLMRGSVRRLIVAAGLGLLVAFVAFPFSRSSGFLSRETLDPTLLALVPSFPLLALIPVLLLVTLWLSLRGSPAAPAVAVASGLASAGFTLVWMGQAPSIGKLAPVTGLMEALAALGLALLVGLLAVNRPASRGPILAAAAVVGLGAFWWFSNPQGGGTLFPRTVGYYQLIQPTPSGVDRQIVEDYNQALPQLNAIRKETGQSELAPIASLSELQGRIPAQAAQDGYRLVKPNDVQYGSFAVFLLAGLMVGAGLMQLRNPRLQQGDDLQVGLLIALIVCILVPAFDATEFSLERFLRGLPFFRDFLDKAHPPLLAAPDQNRFPLEEVFVQTLLTLQMAFVGTFLAAIFALPVSFLAARNVTSGSPVMRAVFFVTRFFLNALRGIPTLILALILVAGLGLGPFAGVLAIAIHSFTELGKLYSEAIENTDKGPIEAIESTGASGVNVVRWAILPQTMPLFVSYTVYNFEINFRSSLVLGLVGAGGIGYFINEKMASGQYDQMSVAVYMIMIMVNLIDFASSWLRSRLV